jgi:putative transposase
MMGFKAFHSAQATIAGIETAHMIRKGQLSEENMPAYNSSRRSDSMKSSVSP